MSDGAASATGGNNSPIVAAAAASGDVVVANDPFNRGLEDFLRLLASLQHDKAKESAEKMLEHRRGTRHQQFCSVLGQLAVAERQYMQAGFLLPKGFFQKDNQCKQSYDLIHVELSKLSSSLQSSSSSLLSSVSRQLASFVSCRAKTMELYERACQAGTASVASQQQQTNNAAQSHDLNIEDLAKEARQLSSSYIKSLTEPCLALLKQLLTWELNMLSGYLTSLCIMDAYNFYETMEQMRVAARSRSEWTEFVHTKIGPQAKLPSLMAGLGLKSDKQQEPLLFVWFTRILRDACLTKHTFVFDLSLHEGTLNQEEQKRKMKAKLNVDMHARMTSFQKRTDAYCVAVVYDASDDEAYRGWPSPPHPPWIWPSVEAARHFTGMDLFPAIFSSPEWPHPKSHWPSVVMMLENHDAGLDARQEVVTFYDKRADMTFFLYRLCPPRMTTVVMYEGRKKQTSDVQLVTGFLKESAATLGCAAVFAKLKPGV